MKRVLIGLTAVLLITAMNGCGGTDSETSYKERTINHFGYDFSKDTNDTNMTGGDGETVGWADNNVYVSGQSNGDGVWFRPRKTDDANQNIFFYDTGKSSLDDVGVVDTGKWMKKTDPWPRLEKDHVYVFRALDGYVKFQVENINTSFPWPTKIKYEYSADKTF